MKNASEIFKDLPDGSEFLDGSVLELVRCCGSCKHFDNEDICGGGWCVATDHATACGDDCPKWHQDFYTPNTRDKVQAMVGQVASISLPVGVKELAGMVDDLEKKHGKGLVMRKIGNALIISQSNEKDQRQERE